jgi:hypothetical protein
MYAENDVTIAPTESPDFVTVLHAHPPYGDARAVEVLEIARAIATSVGRPVERVHVQYALAAAGRQAFGDMFDPQTQTLTGLPGPFGLKTPVNWGVLNAAPMHF